MMPGQQYLVFLRALSRISPRMAVYMIRRLLRNRLAVVFPKTYRHRIARIEVSLPGLAIPFAVPESLINISTVYQLEYKDIIADAAVGRLTFFGRMIDFGSCSAIDWNIKLPDEGDHQLWNTKLAHMGFVCAMMLEPGSIYQDAIGEIVHSAQVRADMATPGAFHSFWFPYAASHRILAIGSAYLLACKQGTIRPDVAAKVSSFLRLNVAFVLDNIEHELCNNHVERNLAALCLYFSYTESIPNRIGARLERFVDHIIRHTILADGTQIERSPMYQGLSMTSLELMRDAKFLSAELRSRIDKVHKAVSKTFAVLCHPDRNIALFNDAWHGEVPRLKGPHAPDGCIVLEQGGYGRLAAEGDVCLLDAGSLGPSWNPGHGHSDFLSIEVSLGGERLVVDPGTSHYNTGSERAWERSSAAHNGPVWKGYEPVEFLGCFKVGRMVAAQLLAIDDINVVAGIFRDKPGAIARAVKLFPDSGFLVVDLMNGVSDGEINWLISGAWSIYSDSNNLSLAHQRVPGGSVISFMPDGIGHTLTGGHHATHYGRQLYAHQIRVSPIRRDDEQYIMSWFGHRSATEAVILEGNDILLKLRKAIAAG
jgi:hypothetical protein